MCSVQRAEYRVQYFNNVLWLVQSAATHNTVHTAEWRVQCEVWHRSPGECDSSHHTGGVWSSHTSCCLLNSPCFPLNSLLIPLNADKRGRAALYHSANWDISLHKSMFFPAAAEVGTITASREEKLRNDCRTAVSYPARQTKHNSLQNREKQNKLPVERFTQTNVGIYSSKRPAGTNVHKDPTRKGRSQEHKRIISRLLGNLNWTNFFEKKGFA